jgi:hypothetical protein
LTDTQPVTPPYPMATRVREIELQPRASYTLIHGFVTVAGKFRSLTLLGTGDRQLTNLLQVLEKWEFRPAMNANTPAEVEVLLAIPPG